MHACGVGDFTAASVSRLPDPCPLPETDPEVKSRRGLNAKVWGAASLLCACAVGFGFWADTTTTTLTRLPPQETLLYAPMANIGKVLFDADAVYIDVPEVHFSKASTLVEEGHNERVAVEGVAPDAEAADAAGAHGSDSDSVDPLEVINKDDDGTHSLFSTLSLPSPHTHSWHISHRCPPTPQTIPDSGMGVKLLKGLQDLSSGIDDRLGASSGLSLFKGSAPVDEAAADAMLLRSATKHTGDSEVSSSSGSSDDDSDSESGSGSGGDEGTYSNWAASRSKAGTGTGAGAGAGVGAGAAAAADMSAARWKAGLNDRALAALRERYVSHSHRPPARRHPERSLTHCCMSLFPQPPLTHTQANQ